MQEILIKILIAIGMKLLTEGFVAQTIVFSLKALADKSGKELPEELVAALAKALDVAVPNKDKA